MTIVQLCIDINRHKSLNLNRECGVLLYLSREELKFRIRKTTNQKIAERAHIFNFGNWEPASLPEELTLNSNLWPKYTPIKYMPQYPGK